MPGNANFLWVSHSQPQLGLGNFPGFWTHLGFISWEHVMLLLLRKNTMTKDSLWRSRVISCGRLQSITKACQGRYSRPEGRHGTETETSAAYCRALYGLLRLLFCITAHCTKETTTLTTNYENQRSIWWGHSFMWGSLFSNDPSLCQFCIRPTSTKYMK